MTPARIDEKGKHQAFAWNIGTTGRQTSSQLSPSRVFAVSAWIAIARWEYTTPFGWPVVPLV